MKVCPSCQSRYDQGETFCPSDGTKLVDARELSPGELTDQTLDGVVELEELLRSDAIGERYRGRLTDGGDPVTVTVFNRAAEPRVDRLDSAAQLRQQLGESLPIEILGVPGFDIDREEAPYVLEEPATGTTLREILDEHGKLHWRDAVRIAARLAQVLHWMATRGHVHRGLHAGAIYLQGPDQSESLQVGDWLQTHLTYSAHPLEDASESSIFYGFAPYLPPEAIRDEDSIDERSPVYTIGMLLYELILGKPPFYSDDPQETLKRHLHEKPLKLAIASGDEDLHPELDDVLSMMWAKDPEDRFQSPRATIAALASLIDADQAELAPALSEETETSADSDGGRPAKTLMGMGQPHPDDAEDVEQSEDDADGAEKSDSKVDATTSGVQIPSPSTVDADQSSEIQSGEAAIQSDEDDADGSAEIPSIIIEDPEIESEMGTDEDEEASDSNDLSEDSFSTWSEALRSGAQTPSEEAVVTGYVDAKQGVQHNPDGGSVPVSVQAENITNGPSASPEGSSSQSGETSTAGSDAGGGNGGDETPVVPTTEIDIEKQMEEADVSQEKTAEMDVEEQIAKAKAQLREEENGTADAEPPDSTSEDESSADREAEEALEELETESEPEDVDQPAEADPSEQSTESADQPDASEDEDATTQEQHSSEESEASAEDSIERIESEDVVILDEGLDEDQEEEGGEEEQEPPEMPSGTGAEPPPEAEVPPEVAAEPGAAPAEAGESGEVTVDASESNETVSGTASTGTTSADAAPPEDSPSDAEPSSPEAPEGAKREIFDADGNVTTDASDEWFEVTDEEAWMAADVREERDRSEVFRQYITWGLFILLASIALGLIVMSQTYSPEEGGSKQNSEQTAEE